MHIDIDDDVDVEAIIEVLPCMRLGMLREYENFQNRLEVSETRCNEYINYTKGCTSVDCPSLLRRNLNEFELEFSKNSEIIEEKKGLILQLKKIEEEMIESIAQNKQKVDSLKQKITHTREKIKSLEEKRDKILVYKLLTSTNFSYEGINISGYVANPNTKKFKCFDKPPDQEITNDLYETIRKVFQGSS